MRHTLNTNRNLNWSRFSVEFSSKPIISLNVWSLQLDKTAFLAHAPLSLTSFKSVVDSFIGWFVFFSLLFCCVLLSLRNVELRPRMNAEYQKPYGYRVGCVPHGEPLHKSNEWARLEYRCCSSVLHRLLIITIVCVSFLEIFSSVFSRVYS